MIPNALYRNMRTVALLVAGITLGSFASAQTVPAARFITTPINTADRISLSGSMRRDIRSAIDHGAATPSLKAHHVHLVLQRSAVRQAALDQYMSDVQNPQSAEYRHWLTPAEYGARFGASPDDVQTIVAWLQSQGLTVERISPAANVINFSGNVGQLDAAFATSIHSLTVRGESHLANITEPQLPRAIAPAVKSIVGLDDFRPHSALQKGPTGTFNSASHRIEPDFTLFDNAGNSYLYVDPADAATIYDTPNAALNTAYKGTTYDGTGLTIGVVGDSDVDMSGVKNYRTAFLGETSANVNLPTVIVDGADPGTNGDQLEAWLDLEVLGGIAPKAKINYYVSADSDLSPGIFNAMERAINDNAVSILSISYGECEANAGTATTQFVGELFQQAAAQGITVTVSTGDSGAAGCDRDTSASATQGLAVSGLGSSPFNVAVGGTDYDVIPVAFNTYVTSTSSGTAPYYGTALSYIPERPWNDSTVNNGALAANQPYSSSGATNIIGGTGGKSVVFTKPAYQSTLTPADGARDVPDVAFLAGNGFYGAVWVLCEVQGLSGPDCANTNGTFTSTSRFSGAGGTSAATPAFAGMLALVEQAVGSRLGNVNPVLYKLAASKYSTVFHDVTTGNNAVVCTAGTPNCGSNGFTTGYDAGVGYDLASGLGSVDIAALLANWSGATGASSSTTLTINGSTAPVSVVHGTSLNFAVAVNPSTATGSAGLITTESSATGVPSLNGQGLVLPVTHGAGTGSYNGLPGGQYTVYANYGGDTNTAASQSAPISVNISPEPSSTQLFLDAYTPTQATISNLTAVPYGSYVFVETSVYGTAEGFNASLGYATGTMTIYDNGSSIGTSPITSGNFSSFPTIAAGVYPFAVGPHLITAKYPGDASYSANTSSGVAFTVVRGSTGLSLFPTTTTVQSASSDNIEVDITTSSLANPPTGTLTLTTNGKTLGTTTMLNGGISSSGTAVSFATFNVQGSQLVNGANTLTATYSGDSNYSGSTNTVVITATSSSFTLRTSAISVNAGATTGNTVAVNANSSGNFAGLVNLTCSVTSAPQNATSPITCSIPKQINLTGTTPASTTLTINSTTNTTSGTYVVTIAGTDAATGKITASTLSTVTVTGTPAISLSNSGAITLAAGATAGNTSTLTVTPTNGYTGAINITCAVTTVPAGAMDPITCGVSPSTITITGTNAGTATLTISSAARTTASIAQPTLRRLGETMLAIGLFFFLPVRRRRQLRGLLAVVALVSLGSLIGCGGSSSGGGTKTPTTTGTTAGAYVVTVTATPTGAAAQTATVNVTVN